MRLRNIPRAEQVLAESRFVVQEPVKYRGKWNVLFGNEHPVHIEIGMGKGKFLTALAKGNPEINYIGIEKYASVLLRAVEKLDELTKAQDNSIANLKLIWFDAEHIGDIFAEGEVGHIYLNFSDPWPKDRHARRRLTSKEYLDRYDHFLRESGAVEFKTDNKELFQFTLEQAVRSGWKLSEVTEDLHHSEYAKGNVMTEYEEKFSSLGKTIYHCKQSRG